MKQADAVNLGSRYRFLRELGRGGVGRVLLVRDAYLRKNVACKLLREELVDSGEFDSIRREFALLNELSHPGIAPVHDFGYLRGVPFFTSEYIGGRPLEPKAREWTSREAVGLARQLAEPVAFLHQNEILHLDIKPSNILGASRGSRRQLVLIDFGLFRRACSREDLDPRRGSLPYMAPEHFRAAPLGPWTDVYAIGASLYRLLSGRYPRSRILADDDLPFRVSAWEPLPLPPSSLCPDLSPDLENIILRCLALEPEERFQDAGELLDSLARVAGTPDAARKVTVRASESVSRTIGREAELEEVDRFLSGLDEDGPCRVLIVTGSPGMGQSQVFRDIKVRAQTRRWSFYLETGYPGRVTAPGSLLRCLGYHMDDSDARNRWTRFLARVRRRHSSYRNETVDSERRLRRAVETQLAMEALTDSVVIGVDGLQFWDEVSIELVLELARLIAAGKSGLALVLGYREEGPALPVLRELSRELLAPARAKIISLRALSWEGTRELFRRRTHHSVEIVGNDEDLALFQETGGCPARIVARAHGREEPRLPAATEDGRALGLDHLPPASPEGRNLLLALHLLGRPAEAGELARICGLVPVRARSILEAMRAARLVSANRNDRSRRQWLAGSITAEFLEDVPARDCHRIHRRIAEELLTRAAGDPGPRKLEALRHLRASGNTRSLIRHGLEASRYLKETFQNRAALRLLCEVYDALPKGQRRTRIDVAVEIAQLHLLVGQLEQGVDLLRELNRDAQKRRSVADVRVLVWLATLHARRGDYERADALFQAGFTEVKERRLRLPRGDHLRLLTEQAAVKSVLGDHAGGRRLCEHGLRLAARSRSPSLEVEEMVINLHATQGNIALRNLEYDEAARQYETASHRAEAIGSLADLAVIANNLGVVYSQSDRYRDAIQAFEEAERTCLQMDEGPSLASIYTNLAVLHAKCGDADRAERRLEQSAQLRAAVLGPRQQAMLAHGRGLCLLYRGRHREARRAIDEAVELARTLGDSHLWRFDRVYHAEALIFDSAYDEAHSELAQLTADGHPTRVRRMAFARQAFLRAITGNESGVEAAARSYDELVAREQSAVPFLDACDDLLLGWALAVSGDLDRGIELLSRAASFFQGKHLRPFEELSVYARAEGLLVAGRHAEALALLEEQERGPRPSHDLAAAGGALLKARLLLETEDEPDARYADLLARAGALLVANPLPEWSLRMKYLRGLIQLEDNEWVEAVDEERRALARRLPRGARDSYLASRLWRAWTSLRRPPERRVKPATVEGTELRGEESRDTALLPRRPESPLRRQLVTRSAVMRELVGTLDRLRDTEFPVLIEGETGTGKELIARILHEESSRASSPFRVVDCAGIPESLFEAELFGVRAGVFTGQIEDRPGLLAEMNSGTVLLDEIGAVPAAVQVKLLRVLGERRARPVGAEEELPVKVRFFFSTSLDLESEVKAGRFREDLFHRLNVMHVVVPPLRERREDIVELVRRFRAEQREDRGGHGVVLGDGVMRRLQSHGWPGNVRQLRNVIVRLTVEDPGELKPEALEKLLEGGPDTAALFSERVLSGESLPVLQRRLERDYFRHHLRRLGGDLEELRRFLGLSRRQLFRRCARVGLRLREEKKRIDTHGLR